MTKHDEATRFLGLAPMDELLSAVSESMPDAILSGEGEDRMARRAAQLPACGLESTFGFESRLDEDLPRCDLFLSARPNSEFSRYLIRKGVASGASPAARGLSRFLAELNNAESQLSKWFGTSILEYDLVKSPAGAALDPGVFIEPPSADVRAQDSLVTRGHTALACPVKSLISSLCLAAGREVDGLEARTLVRVMGALPIQGELLHAGALPSRSPQAVRLVFRMPSAEVIPFLERVGWRGCVARLAEVLSHTGRMQSSKRLSVACDVVRGEVASRVGIELFLKQAWMDATARQWSPTLDLLVEKGWCRAEKASALFSWPKRDALVSENGVLRLITGINHLKILLDDAGIRSKAYIGAFLFSP